MLRNPNAATVGVLIACFTLTWMMLDGFRKDLKGDIAAVEVRLEGKIAAVEVNIAAVEARLSADIRETEARLDRRLTRVENRLDRIMEILPGGRDASDPEDDLSQASSRTSIALPFLSEKILLNSR